MDEDDHEVDRHSSSSSSSSRWSGDQPESEKGSDVGGVWLVGNVEEFEDEEVEDGTDQSDGFTNIHADKRDGFSKSHANSKIRAD